MDRSDCFFSRDGIPKICVPITGWSRDDIVNEVHNIIGGAADFAEWRLDCYDNAEDAAEVLKTLCIIKDIMCDMPLLVTFRTANEGGKREISFDRYRSLLLYVAENGSADMIDVEMFFSLGVSGTGERKQDFYTVDSNVCKLVSKLKEHVTVIGSYHDFNRTPSLQEMVDRLCLSVKYGADIPKLAVMPHSEEDVLSLLQATVQAKKELNVPVITMSMGKMGVISRLTGESFGSCVTFGCVGKESAPGQVNANVLRGILEGIHKCQL